ncbi:MAG: hypothetical protein WA634_01740 [Silvibacterium sp.]
MILLGLSATYSFETAIEGSKKPAPAGRAFLTLSFSISSGEKSPAKATLLFCFGYGVLDLTRNVEYGRSIERLTIQDTERHASGLQTIRPEFGICAGGPNRREL